MEIIISKEYVGRLIFNKLKPSLLANNTPVWFQRLTRGKIY